MAYYVKPRVVDAAGLGCWDPDRRDRLSGAEWRLVPPSPYWLHLQRVGDIELRAESDPPDGGQAEPVAEPETASAAPAHLVEE